MLKGFILGTNFYGSMCDYDIQIGSSYHCPIVNMSSSQLICQITAGSMLDPRRNQLVRIARNRQGYLGTLYRMLFKLQPSIFNITPMLGKRSQTQSSTKKAILRCPCCLLGSIFGGTHVTIVGDGFIESSTFVLIQGINYTYVGSTSNSRIIFTTRPQLTYINLNLSVAVYVRQSMSVCQIPACHFSWATSVTPYFDSVSPSLVRGPTNLTITGRNLLAGGNSTVGARVNINGNLCNITGMNNASVICTVSGVEAGQYPIVGSLDGLFV